MKEEANISIGLLTTNKWQPSVLQLLPFSNNNVGAKPTRNGSGISNPSYADTAPDRGFPMLAVTRTENPKPRSKSANTPGEVVSSSKHGVAAHKFGKGQQRRLLRASSERLARGAERTSATNGLPSAGGGAVGDRHKTKLRARSDYGISSFYKRPEVVKISVNDINEQILGRNRVQSAATTGGESTLSTATCESPDRGFRVRMKEGGGGGAGGGREGVNKGSRPPTVPAKSALKPSQGRWPHSGLTFWSSAATGAASAGSSRGTSAAGTPGSNKRARTDAETGGGSSRSSTARGGSHYYRRGDGRRVKLNVNELPRSKTPIADYDPDKLNMQHVIAFLQTSGGGQEDEEDEDEVGGQGRKLKDEGSSHVTGKTKSGHPASRSSSPSKRSVIDGVMRVSPLKNGLISMKNNEHLKGTAATVQPAKKNNNRLSPGVEESEVTPHRLSFNKASPSPAQWDEQKEPTAADDISGVSRSNKPATESMELYRKTRATTNSLLGGSLQYSDYKAHSLAQSHERRAGLPTGTGPPSYPDLQDIHIPLSIRKIRDRSQTTDTRPFRLHRFLTLVPNGSDSLLNAAPEKAADRNAIGGAATLSKRPGSRERQQGPLRRGSGGDKPDRRRATPPRRSHPDSNLYYLDVSSAFNEDGNRPRSKGDKRSSPNKSRQAGSQVSADEADQLRKDVNRVIRLPRAHYEADSDEEGSPYCTVPAARNKRALTLSAQGRSIKDIISGNSSKTNTALHATADKQAGFPKGKLSKPEKVAAKQIPNNASDDVIPPPPEQSVPKSDEVIGATNAEERAKAEESTSSNGVSNPLPEQKSLTADHSDTPSVVKKTEAIKKPEVSAESDPVPAMTFRDMLHLRSEPGVSLSTRDSPGDTVDPGGTTFLTQAQPSLSDGGATDQQRLSPTSNSSPKSRISLPSITKADGRSHSSSATNNSSPSPTRDLVKLSLRKERNKTRELTYMFEVDTEAMQAYSSATK